jgi:glycosyltransferase involved in cell wall biosynthesis
LIVHSHLRWDFVWQRPQQFLSRLSKQRPVLFCEAPQLQEENNEPYYTLHKDETFPNVTVMQTHFPASRFAAGDGVDAQRLELLQSALDEFDGEFANPIQWFYDPMAAPVFLGKLDEAAVVYDCMDELSQFKFAPPELIEREQMLLAAADVVFAGGRKMWQSKSRFNDNCHFYGCGVDIAHFGLARSRSTPIPGDIAHLRAPILGYFGVVDERMDYELVAALADDNPDWNIVIVGPTAKIDERDLPRRTNLHWLGGRGYSTLPAYAKAFDVCLMPFALNEATEFINPTKALEYMATATPVVSTAVPDVVSNFSSALHIAHSHDEFIAQCRAALKEPDKILIESGLRLAQQNTWEAIVAKMEAHLADATASREYSQRAADLPHAPVSGDSVN